MERPWFLVDKVTAETAKQNKKLVCYRHKTGSTAVRVAQAALTVAGPWGDDNTTCLIGQCPDCQSIYWYMDTKYQEVYKYDEEYHATWN